MRGMVWALFNGAAEDVEDAEQEILTSLFMDLPKFRFHSSFGTYFFRYCRNKAIDRVRKLTREARVRQAAVIQAAASAPAPGPEEGALARERSRRISAALAGLSEEERLLVAMREGEGMAVGEIAVLLGMRTGTVKSKLFRAREKLARKLGGAGL